MPSKATKRRPEGRAFDPADFTTPGVPRGYTTFWAYMSRKRPFAFEIMLEMGPLEGLFRADEREAELALARRRMPTRLLVEAPPALKLVGVTRVPAFPTSIVEQVILAPK